MTVSRRGLLVGGLTLAGLVACSRSTVLADPAEPLPPVADRLAALGRRHNARIGVHAVDLGSDRSVEVGADDMLAMCSTFKAYASAAVLQRAQQGRLALADPIAVQRSDIRPHSPVTEPRVGTTMTLAELCQAAAE